MARLRRRRPPPTCETDTASTSDGPSSPLEPIEATTPRIVVDKEIPVVVHHADVEELVLVDLPGIIHNGPGSEEVRAMIQRYISKPECLMAVVHHADTDNELVTASEYAGKVDGNRERTIEILTKADTFMEQENKVRAIKRVRDDEPLMLGAHIVVARTARMSCPRHSCLLRMMRFVV
jgi:hypothetical protein